jgi:hypothetical protein
MKDGIKKTIADINAKLSAIRNEVVDGITAFMHELGVTEISLGDFSSTPVIGNAPSDDSTYTLDGIIENHGLRFYGSSCYDNCIRRCDAVDVETLAEILEWLYEHKDAIVKMISEE